MAILYKMSIKSNANGGVNLTCYECLFVFGTKNGIQH